MTTTLSKQIGKTLTPPKAFFKWCESQLPIYKWKNMKQTILSSERDTGTIIEKRLTKTSRLDFPEKFYPFGIILVSKTRIEIQSYGYWLDIKGGKEKLEYRLTNFERFSNNAHIKAHNSCGDWYNGLLANYGYMSGAYTRTLFYPNDWQSTLKKNQDMRYLDLPPIQRYNIERIYKYREEIEYLQKIGNYSLSESIMFSGKIPYGNDYFSTVDMSIINKKWLKRYKSLLKNSDKSFNEIMLQIDVQKHHGKMVDGGSHLVHYKQMRKLPKAIKRTKFLNYIKKQKFSNFSISYYLDYINMLQELDTPLDDSMVFPKDLQKAHDKAVDTINRLERELKRQTYDKRLNQIKNYDKEIDEFVFLVPKDLQEIVDEGNELRHCVGNQDYLDRHANGQTTIVFIRQKDKPNQPYFTMEYANQRVVQIQGKRNREEVPTNISQAVGKWEKHIKKIS